MPALDKITIEWDEQDRPLITVQYADERDDTSTEADKAEFLKELAGRLSDESATNLRAIITANDAGGPIALADLATQVGVDKKKIDGWNRGLGRSVKAIVREYGFLRTDQEDGTAQLFDFVWDNDGSRWLYVVPKEFRGMLAQYLDER
jgi:hypothetical protein